MTERKWQKLYSRYLRACHRRDSTNSPARRARLEARCRDMQTQLLLPPVGAGNPEGAGEK